jgi:uncharacterized protein YegJ (DUF2314 family)
MQQGLLIIENEILNSLYCKNKLCGNLLNSHPTLKEKGYNFLKDFFWKLLIHILISRMKTVPVIIFTFCIILTVNIFNKSSGEIYRRKEQRDKVQAEKVFYVSGKDPEMNKAIQTARNTVNTFIAALNAPAPGQDRFSVKKPFKEGSKVEHMWLSNVSFKGGQFSGLVENEPVKVNNVTYGQAATAAQNEISDWYYIDNGKLVGGYTIRVLYSRMSPAEKKDFDAHMNFKL